MAVTIGSARIDERGKTAGGAPGDQTGKEVSAQAFYAHTKGWRVFRPKDTAAAEKLAAAMRAACANENIGYSQGERNALWKLVRDKGYDPAKADEKTSCDCSSLARVCCAYAGIMTGDFTTESEPKALAATGAFTELSGAAYTKTGEKLQAGDILVTASKGHTAVVLTPARASGTVLKDGKWNVRSGAGKGFVSLGTLAGGTALTVLERTEDGWLRVAFESAPAYGWVSESAVRA